MGFGIRRVTLQAIGNTLCFGSTATLLTYTLVRVAMGAGHRYRKHVIAAITVFLAIWFAAGSIVYLAFCRTLYRRSTEGEERQHPSGSDDNARLPQYDVQRRQGHGMDVLVLPREPPVHGSVVIPAYEEPDCNLSDGAPECAVCREEVEKREMVRRFPECQHVFHQHCIGRRLRLREHSTCPICRINARAPLLDHMV